MDRLERTYGSMLKMSFKVLNPFKKAIIKTECKVHKFINVHALDILKNDGHQEEYHFFYSFIIPMNEGAVWADQDFKSSSHFYNPRTKKGMYGRVHAMDLGKSYYDQALQLWEIGEHPKAMFYLGAALHIIQDMTIPQHANVRLLDNHRQYETFVKRTYRYVQEFKAEKGTLDFDSYEEFIRFNGRVAMKIYKRFKVIQGDEQRYYRVTRCTLPLAERTTAGCMRMFYQHIAREKQLN